MRLRSVWLFVLVAYVAIVINVLVFKNIPDLRIGGIMLNLGGTVAGGDANLVPFRTIAANLQDGGVGLINLVGNVALLVPVGLLFPLVHRSMNWAGAMVVAVSAGLILEGMQVLFNVGTFDVDDLILNSLGVLLGYLAFAVFANRDRRRSIVR
jgi:glycopeptide antibiotics resistance protein